MLTRTITAVVLVAVLAVVVFCLPEIAAALLFSVMAAVAAYELLYRTGLVRQRRLVIYSAAAAFAVPLWCYFGMNYVCGLLGTLAFTMALFGEIMAAHTKLPFGQTVYCFAAGLVFPYFLSSLVRIRGMELGLYYILIPFIVAFISDTGAYLTGRLCGRHKLAPVISPKKTVEGMVGGIAAAVAGMAAYCAILQYGFHLQVWYPAAVVYGLVGSLGGVFGDLCFSVVKRQTGIKDYGNCFPGHGGILDRFDSMMIVGPMMEALLLLLPVVV